MSFRDLSLFRKKSVPVKRQVHDPVSLMRSNMESLFDDFFKGFELEPFFGPDISSYSPKVDVKEGDKEIKVLAELPGMDENDINVTLNRDSLTLRGEKKEEKEDSDKGYHRLERSYGSFCRTIPLPVEIESDNVSASYKKGILTITIPKSKKAIEGKKKIKIDVK
ncbi:MAG: Hsp20/alpha crystallin family protein [Nitrospiraceae bacterium]|nr:MAG: Hsp20/alpha crystallin family protein [Nitrospiraceae bacterium]